MLGPEFQIKLKSENSRKSKSRVLTYSKSVKSGKYVTKDVLLRKFVFLFIFPLALAVEGSALGLTFFIFILVVVS